MLNQPSASPAPSYCNFTRDHEPILSSQDLSQFLTHRNHQRQENDCCSKALSLGEVYYVELSWLSLNYNGYVGSEGAIKNERRHKRKIFYLKPLGLNRFRIYIFFWIL